MADLSKLFLVGFAVVCTGLILHIVGVATNEWEVQGDASLGLWKACRREICVSVVGTVSSKWEACQAFGIIGILTCGFGVLLALTHIIFSVTGKSSSGKLPLLSFCACLMSGVSIFICIVIWGASIHDEVKLFFNVGFSYILCIIANALIPVGGFLVYIGGKS